MIIVKLYTRKRCPLCDKAKKNLLELQKKYDFSYIEVDIAEDDFLTETYGLIIPVLEINGAEIQYGQIDKQPLKNYFKKIYDGKLLK